MQKTLEKITGMQYNQKENIIINDWRKTIGKNNIAAKNKNKAKNQKNNFFQNQCVLSWDDKSINTHYNTFMQ